VTGKPLIVKLFFKSLGEAMVTPSLAEIGTRGAGRQHVGSALRGRVGDRDCAAVWVGAVTAHDSHRRTISVGPGPPQGANMATTPFTLVGNSADSPELPLRPSPATGHAAEILDVEDPYLGYYAEKFP
jgi:hypothetical protein